jgi:hypothetical protein
LDGTDELSRRNNSSKQPASAHTAQDRDADADADDAAASPPDSEPRDVPRNAPGPAGLPAPDPDAMRADPTEGDADATTGMGRG